ncbi:MAG: DUF1553 domain-containing protein, partial [Planctomycetaceae bacterium]|nr:DUF1553 domain-containing protein [Planctomycetaceae bacterium]
MFAYLNNADEPYIELQDEQREQTFRRNRKKADLLLAELRNRARPSKFSPVLASLTQLTADAGQTIQVSENSDNLVTVTGDNPATATYRLRLQPKSTFQAVRLIASTPQGASGPGRTPHGNFVLSELQLRLLHPDGSSEDLTIRSATATAEQPGHTADNAFDKDTGTGWAVHTSRGVAAEATATFLLEPMQPPIRPGDLVEVALVQTTGGQHTLAQFQVQFGQIESVGAAAQDAEFQQWLESERPNAVSWQTMKPLQATSSLPLLTIEEDDTIFATGDTAKRDDYVITLEGQPFPIHAIRLEALPDERLPARGPGTTYYEGTPGDFYLTEIGFRSGDTTFSAASASHSFAKNRFGRNPATAALAIDGDIQTGWSVHGRQGERHVAVFVLKEPIPAGRAVTIDMAFGRHFASSLGRFSFAASSSTTQPLARDWSPEVAALLALPAADWTTAQRQQVQDTWLLSRPEFQADAEQIRKLLQRPTAVTSLVLQERPDSHPRPTYRHHRGEYLQPKERVIAGLPSILAGGPAPTSRLEFARWLVSDDNPLTARVVANRQWAAFFGTGLVRTLDDFGLQGETPSHPQLLDWLAVKLRTTDQWSLRKLHKRIVTSAVYRQAAMKNPSAASTDPGNRLLSYSPRFVLEAEIIRDQLLAAAGILSDKMGGP